MRFGLLAANIGAYAHPEAAMDLALTAEAAGFDSLWTSEHVVFPAVYRSPYPYHERGLGDPEASPDLSDPIVWLSYVAAGTERIRLATGVLILPQRNPLVLAKQVASLDVLSGGRVDLGIGVGWLREEFEALGVPWERRGERTDDYVAAMRAVWAGDRASHDGPFAAFEPVCARPAPVQGSVPIIVGGSTVAAARRAGRLGDGFFPFNVDDEALAGLVTHCHQAAREHDRDPERIEVVTNLRSSQLDRLAGLAAVGVTRVVMMPMDLERVRAFAAVVADHST
jgi:probable F420-dependent oxidoreductase